MRCMFGFGFRKQFAALRRAYEAGSPAQRLATARELVELCIIADDLDDAVPLLELMLLDTDDEVSTTAKRGFMACHELAVMPLMRLIENARAEIRERACDALGSLQEEVDTSPARPALLAALADPVPAVRGRAAFALGIMRDTSPSTIDALAALARDSETEVRSWALHAIGNIGRAEGAHRAIGAHAATLLAALDDPDADTRWSAAYALGYARLPAERILPKLLERLRVEDSERASQPLTGLVYAVAKVVDMAPHLPQLLDLAGANERARDVVIGICAGLGQRGAAIVPMLREKLARDDVPLHIVTAYRAITGRTDECIPVLLRMLNGELHQALAAGKLLLEITGDPAPLIPMLERALEKSPDEPGMFIQEIGRPLAAAAPVLARAMERNFAERDWDVMWNLTCAMAALESAAPEAVAALSKSLTHESDRVQYAAVGGLAHAGSAASDAMPVLKRFAAGDGALAEAARETIRAIGKRPN